MARRLLALALAVLPLPALAQPQPPCGQAVSEPAFAAPGGPPAARTWSESELARWAPPACLGWSGRTRMAGAIAGEFAFAGPLDALLDRVGDFSRYRSISYWSTTRGRWEPLVSDAGLLGGANGARDLLGRDFQRGGSFAYFEEGRAGRTTHTLTVLERSEDRIVVALANKTALRLGPLSLFDPGALQTVLFLERRGGERWAYYEVVRAGEGTSALALSSPQSYLNRMMAFFGFLSGQQPSRAG